MGNLVSSSLIQPQLSSPTNIYQTPKASQHYSKILSLVQPWPARIQIQMSLHMHIDSQPILIEPSLMQRKST